MKLENSFCFTADVTMTHVTKKGIALVSLLFACVSLSAAEITFSPGIGGTVHTIQSFFEIENAGYSEDSMFSQKAVTYIIPVPSTGIDIHFTHETSGFTFSIINNIGSSITLFKKGGFGDEKHYITGSIVDEQLLFGYTYGVKQPFSIHCGIGPGFAAGYFRPWKNEKPVESFYYAVSPLALHIGLQYLFTQHIGITVGIHDMLSFSGIFLTHKSSSSAIIRDKTTGTVGLGNTFTLRVAVSFRL